MTKSGNLSSQHLRFMHWLHARALGFSKPATGFVKQPEPRSIGSYARGLQLKAGNIMFAGHLVEAKDTVLWDIASPADGFTQEAHGFGWLDDLASVADKHSRKISQEWVQRWIDIYGRGSGPGWIPDLTGRRLIRWIHHGFMLLQGIEPEKSEIFFQSLGRQTLFLSKRWSKTTPGLPRFEALTGLIFAGLTLDGMEQHVRPATSALARECRTQVDSTGGIHTRNPEELLEVFTLLTWVASALTEAGWIPSDAHLEALDRIAPTLRSLRHVDGSLARFHGGGKGLEGRLDMALVHSGNRTVTSGSLVMGYARLSAGRTSIILDAASPPTGRASINGHASTLAFELSSGRSPLIVNCGSGESFGADWRRAGRATPSHSTLCLNGISSASLGRPLSHTNTENESLIDGPSRVPYEFPETTQGLKFEAGHNGYLKHNGLTHVRRLDLSSDGSALSGEDMLLTLDPKDQKPFQKAFDASGLQGISFQLRFHLHPDVAAEVDLGGMAVSFALKTGEIWVFRYDADVEVTLEPSVYFEKNRLRPRSTKQVVLSFRAIEYATRVRWSLSKVQETDFLSRDDLEDISNTK
jgi:uncharacterized heparinase superfamily protein